MIFLILSILLFGPALLAFLWASHSFPWLSPGPPPRLQIGRVSCLLGIYTPCPLAPQLHFQDCCPHRHPLNWNCPSENHATLPRAYTQHPDSSLLPPNQSLGCLNSISIPPCMTSSVPLTHSSSTLALFRSTLLTAAREISSKDRSFPSPFWSSPLPNLLV